jgi:hypothetical protein
MKGLSWMLAVASTILLILLFGIPYLMFAIAAGNWDATKWQLKLRLWFVGIMIVIILIAYQLIKAYWL